MVVVVVVQRMKAVAHPQDCFPSPWDSTAAEGAVLLQPKRKLPSSSSSSSDGTRTRAAAVKWALAPWQQAAAPSPPVAAADCGCCGPSS